jgi:hypothetical protein
MANQVQVNKQFVEEQKKLIRQAAEEYIEEMDEYIDNLVDIVEKNPNLPLDALKQMMDDGTKDPLVNIVLTTHCAAYDAAEALINDLGILVDGENEEEEEESA